MAKDDQSAPEAQPGEEEEAEIAELMLFQTKECYVYMIPPRKSAASYRADEWNVNKWAWEGALRVISKGEECRIKLEDKNTGELYAQAFVRRGQPLPVEPVIDSSRYFALCIEENFGGRMRHAFIGIGFRERPVAYDFQAALYDHVKYLNKKQAAEEMEQQYQTSSSVNYSLKEGQTLKLQLKNPHKGSGTRRSIFFEQELDNLSLDESGEKKQPLPSLALPPPPPAPSSPSSPLSLDESGEKKHPLPSLALPPPPPAPSSPSASHSRSQKNIMSENPSLPSSVTQPKSTISSTIDEGEKEGLATKDGEKGQDSFEDDFGDFQTAG